MSGRKLGPTWTNLYEAEDGSLKNAAILSILRDKCSDLRWFNNCNIGKIYEALIDINEYLNGIVKNSCAWETRPLSERQIICAESVMALIHDEEYSKALHELADCIDDYGTATTRTISINEYALYNCMISCFIKKMEPEADIIHMCEWKPVEDYKKGIQVKNKEVFMKLKDVLNKVTNNSFFLTISGVCNEWYGGVEDFKKTDYYKKYKNKIVKEMILFSTNSTPELCIVIEHNTIFPMEKEEEQALKVAVEALEERAAEEKIIWHDVVKRPPTEEEIKEIEEHYEVFYSIPKYFFDCVMPEEEQEILVVAKDIGGYDGGYYLINGSWDNVIKWAEIPPKYKSRKD